MTADGWVTPAEIARLRGPGDPASAQLLYRFTQAASFAQIRTDVAEVTRALLAGTVTGAASWLAAADQAAGSGDIMEPFVVAFALIGLAMAVLIVGNVISGAVVAGYKRIGVLKSVGLSPAQVMVVYLSRVGWPALAGCLAGVVLGNLLAVPASFTQGFPPSRLALLSLAALVIAVGGARSRPAGPPGPGPPWPCAPNDLRADRPAPADLRQMTCLPGEVA